MKQRNKIFFSLLLSGMTYLAYASVVVDMNPQFFPNGSGSIGEVKPLDAPVDLNWKLSLKNDNDNPNLPASYRTWFYVHFTQSGSFDPVTLTFDKFGFKTAFNPVYSYDNIHWQHFAESEVKWQCSSESASSCELIIHKQFAAQNFWVARFYPYTITDANNFIEKFESTSPSLHRSYLANGSLTHDENKIPFWIIKEESEVEKPIVWVYGRNHPGETPASFIVEGLISTILSDTDQGKFLRKKYTFAIVPLVNVDGAYAGNYRTNTYSGGQNIEIGWYFNQDLVNPWFPLTSLPGEELPWEPYYMYEDISLIKPPFQPGAPVNVAFALNVHASNAAPEVGPFWFPHFSDDSTNEQEYNLWLKQNQLIDLVSVQFNAGWMTKQPSSSSFLNSYFPETWWWFNTRDQVDAITVEGTYGYNQSGSAAHPQWMTPDDLRSVGSAIANALIPLGDERKASKASIKFSTPERIIPGITEDVH